MKQAITSFLTTLAEFVPKPNDEEGVRDERHHGFDRQVGRAA